MEVATTEVSRADVGYAYRLCENNMRKYKQVEEMQEIYEICKCADCRIIIHRISYESWVAGYIVSWIALVW